MYLIYYSLINFKIFQNEIQALLKEREEANMTWYEKFVSRLPDADEVFSYQTQQELNVLDRRLGYVFYIAFVFIFFYIVVYVNRFYQI